MKSRGNFYDKDICKELKENNAAINYIDSGFLVECFNNGSNGVVRYVLNKREDMVRAAFLEVGFDSDKSGNNPLMNMIKKLNFEEDIIIKLWNIMLDTKDTRLKGLIERTNRRIENIFHLCALFKKYNLFK